MNQSSTVDDLSPHARLAQAVIGGVVTASAPAVSPDGSQIAFVVNRVDFDANKTRAQVWLAAVDGSTPPRPLSSGEQNDSQPRWSPDGRSLAFVSARSEKTQGQKHGQATLHVMPIDGPGEVRTVARMPDGISNVEWSPDGRMLGFISRTRDARYDAEDESWQAPRKIERFFTRLNGENWVVDRPAHVHVVAADGTSAPRNLTPGEFQHSGIAWTRDSNAIVTSAARHDSWDIDLAVDLYLVGLDGAEPVALTSRTGAYFAPAVSPDGTRLAFLGHDDPLTDPQNEHVAVMHLATREWHWVSRGIDRTFMSTAGAATPVWVDDATIYGLVDDRGRGHVHRVSADGSADPVPVTDGARWVRSFDAKSGTLAIAVSTVDRPAELAVVRGGEETRLTNLSDAYTASVAPLGWEHFDVPTTDGTLQIDAWIMRPEDFDAASTYPVILNVHGGPHTQYGETFFDEAQFQAKAGFVVLMCNPRGSSGREQSWGQSIFGPMHQFAPGTGWGSVDVDDVMAVLDTALDRYSFCDRDRVGMQGGSYGGYMATTLATRFSDRFKGICSERAVNNLLSEEWSSDIGSVFRVEHGPWYLDEPEEYLRLSPIRHIRDIDVPMLIIHSENDLRCPISQAEELFMGLRYLGKDVTFYRFPGETHELSRSGSPIHRRQRAEIILDWFAEKLKA